MLEFLSEKITMPFWSDYRILLKINPKTKEFMLSEVKFTEELKASHPRIYSFDEMSKLLKQIHSNGYTEIYEWENIK